MRQFEPISRPLLLASVVGVLLAGGTPALQAQSSKPKAPATQKKPAPAKKPAAKPGAKPAPKAASKTPAKIAAQPAAKDTAAKPDSAKSVTYDSYKLTSQSVLRTAPDATPRAILGSGAPVEIVERNRGWVKVRMEGWVRDTELAPADTQVRTTVAAADLRQDPAKWRGATVQWTVEYLSLQKADTLRKGLTAGEDYMLARGPSQEQALVYLVLTDAQLGTVRALSPLSKVTVVAQVRQARSEPAGVPILDVRSLQILK